MTNPKRIRYLSVCSGIEAASVAWRHLGWQCVGVSEVEPFPCKVLAHHYPTVPNLGDMTKFKDWPDDLAPDLLVGGTPCFTGSTLILTMRGLVPIKEVEVGDSVLTHENRWRTVLRTGSKWSETIILKGQGQSSGVVTTCEHPFYSRIKSRKWVGRQNGCYATSLCDAEWVNADSMKGRMWASPSMFPASVAPAIEPTGRERSDLVVNAKLAWVIGRWLGDGWCRTNSRRGYVLICCGKHEAEYLSVRLREAYVRFSRLEERTTTRFQIADRAFAKWLTANFGYGAETKTMPAWVFGWAHRSELLDGYLSADGCRTANGFSLTTISDRLALAAMLIAHSLGKGVSRRLVTPKRKEAFIEGRKVNEQPSWQVRIYDSSRSSVELDGHRWGLVRKVEVSGQSEVFNLEVEGDNSYVADGIVVHNCQSFSVAGLRKGLDDPRGNLMLTYLAIADRWKPQTLCWENVPGVLSSNGGRDFGTFLQGLAELGYGFAYRVLDAQYCRTHEHFGAVPQRRRRVFVVGCLGDWRRAAAILFDSESLQGNPPPRREAGQSVTPDAGRSIAGSYPCGGIGSYSSGDVSSPLLRTGADLGPGCETLNVTIARSIAIRGWDGTPQIELGGDVANAILTPNGGRGGVGVGVGAVMCMSHGQANAEICTGVSPVLTCNHEQPIAFTARDYGADATQGVTPTMRSLTCEANGHQNGTQGRAVAFAQNTRDEVRLVGGDGTVIGALAAQPGMKQTSYVAIGWSEELTAHTECAGTMQRGGEGGRHEGVMTPAMQVRRLTPLECERLQGFPDGWTNIPGASDTARYKALGNSMACNVMALLGERINEIGRLNSD